MKKINNEELKRLFCNLRAGDKNSFQELYEKYRNLVYGIAFSIIKNKTDSEDIVQIVFTKIYNLEREKFPVTKESSWLYSLTKNETISYIRKQNKEIDLYTIYDIKDENSEIDSVIDKNEFNNLISNLNDKEKQIIQLKILGNFSFYEIGKMLGEPVGTIKWRYYKSVHTIKLLLSNLGMFIVTFTIGLTKLLSKRKSIKNQSNENSIIQNVENSENEKQDYSDSLQSNQDRIDSMLEENLNQTENTIEETTENIELSRNNYYEIGFFSVSFIFLIITIILIKYQLNRKVKTSK